VTAVTIVRRNQARTAGSFVAMQSDRFAIDCHGRVAFHDNSSATVSFFGAGDLVTHASSGFTVNQIIALCGNNFTAMVCGVTEYNDSFHRSGLPDKGERVSPADGAIQGH